MFVSSARLKGFVAFFFAFCMDFIYGSFVLHYELFYRVYIVLLNSLQHCVTRLFTLLCLFWGFCFSCVLWAVTIRRSSLLLSRLHLKKSRFCSTAVIASQHVFFVSLCIDLLLYVCLLAHLARLSVLFCFLFFYVMWKQSMQVRFRLFCLFAVFAFWYTCFLSFWPSTRKALILSSAYSPFTVARSGGWISEFPATDSRFIFYTERRSSIERKDSSQNASTMLIR